MTSKLLLVLLLPLLGAGFGCAEGTGMSSSGKKEKSEKKKPQPLADPEEDSADQEEADDDDDDDKPDRDSKDNETEDPKVDKAAVENLPKFAMMANHFDCGFCHVKIYGDIGSTGDVPPARNDSEASIIGDWYARGKIDVQGKGAKVEVSGERKDSYTGKNVPKLFPSLDFSKIKGLVKGKLTASGSDPVFSGKISKTRTGNTVLIGTDASPIEIDGDVFIDGDLVIGGVFKGVGTIYASGVIAIPQTLKAKNSPFPYPESKSDADSKAKKAVKDKKDGLGLASNKTIFVGDPETSIIGDGGAPFNSRPDRDAMYGWLAKDKFRSLFAQSENCLTGAMENLKSLDVIDAFLFATHSIEGKVKNSSLAIRGGFVTDYYNVLNGGSQCNNASRLSNAHGHPANNLYIEYDRRLQTGLYPVLEHLGKAIKKLSE